MNHWTEFTAFVRREVATGGPDPQVALLCELSQGCTPQEKAWLAGCYCSHHCVPSAFVVWTEWELDAILQIPESFKEWLAEHWDGLPVRNEMRSHRMLEKRFRCLTDFASYARNWKPTEAGDYESLWVHSQQSVKYFGRYMAIKYLEILHQMGLTDFAMPDMRADGGWSPRRTLALLYPNLSVLADREDKSASAIAEVERSVSWLQQQLSSDGIRINKFQIQVLLCEYREFLSGSYYPGASHDEELQFIDIVANHFGTEIIEPIYKARRTLFPHENLGEIGGWRGVRKDQMVRVGAF